MKVFYDSQIFWMQDYGGISRYFTELIRRNNSLENLTNLVISHNNYIRELNIGVYDKYIYHTKLKSRIYRVINIILGIPIIIFSKFDVFHSTYYNDYFLPFIGAKPLVITVYDMVHEIFSNQYSTLSTKTIKEKERLVHKANHIIAISENTKKDIIKIYNIDPEKISVIYLGNSLKKWNGVKNLNLPADYLLYVGDRWSYKNFTKFVTAVSSLIIEKNISIVCAGGKEFTNEEILLLKNFGISDKVNYQKINIDDNLSECYSRAIAFIYPSRYEGFGIPILEAWANNCPIVISDTSCFPEIAKDAAIYFDPDDEKSIEKSVRNILEDKKLRNQLIIKGAKRLKNFSWDKTSKETIEVYKKLI